MPWARVRAAVAGVLGAPDEAPFDRILVSAMARELPEELVAQLAANGILVVAGPTGGCCASCVTTGARGSPHHRARGLPVRARSSPTEPTFAVRAAHRATGNDAHRQQRQHP